MKQLIICMLFISCFAATCFAQEQEGEQKTLTFGVRGGLNITNHLAMSLMPSENYKWLCGFNVGMSCDIRKSEKFLGRTGLYYSAKGYKNTYAPYIHLNYMEIPVLAVFQKPLDNNVTLELQAGVYFAYGICGKTKVPTSIGYEWVPSYNVDKRFDWGWNVGAGLNVQRAYIGCAYEVSAFFGKSRTNHCIMVNLGYNFI